MQYQNLRLNIDLCYRLDLDPPNCRFKVLKVQKTESTVKCIFSCQSLKHRLTEAAHCDELLKPYLVLHY